MFRGFEVASIVMAILLMTAATSRAETDHPRFLENVVIDSRIGKLIFEKGFPTPETAARIRDFKRFSRAVEAVTQNTSAVSMARMCKGYADAGAGAPNQISRVKG